jgi:hypothetical protein
MKRLMANKKKYVTESVSLTATPQAVRRLRHEQQLRPEGCLPG